jgi:hypothetical protein
MIDHKTPPSEMIRVPTALIKAVRQLSQLHREGHTIALLQGLEELISQFDSNIDIDVAPGSQSVLQMEEKLDNLESHLDTKLEAITKKLELLERAMASGRYNNTRPRKQAYPYQQNQPVELQPRTNENLAPRLGVTPQSLIAEREKLTPKEFLSYTLHRDPMSTGWEWNAKDGLYHPVK